MKFGISVPNFGEFFEPRTVASLAKEAEKSGWDGFFLWDHLLYMKRPHPVADPWTSLAAIAVETQTIRLGPMVTPLPRRRPWILARETVTLDHLSGGRLILGVGLGEPPDLEYEFFGEEADNRERATRLDEGLDVLTGLWSGRPTSYRGHHYQMAEVTFLPTPLQSPRIPIWVGGVWPNLPPFRRAARYDGTFPIVWDPENPDASMTPEELRRIVAYTMRHREVEGPFDVAVGNTAPRQDPVEDAEIMARFEEAGATWWIDGAEDGEDIQWVRRLVRRGPMGP